MAPRLAAPSVNGCMVDCAMPDYMCIHYNSCAFAAAIRRKARRMIVNSAQRGRRMNELYDHPETRIDPPIIYAVLRACLKNGCKCAICGKPMVFPGDPENPNDNLSIDHIIPLYQGGTNHVDNIMLCHTACNMSKDRVKPGHNHVRNNNASLERD